MAKGHSGHPPQHDSGTPTYIIMSVLFAIVIFALEGMKSTIALAGIDQQSQSTTLAFIGLGLSLCFFWRRLHESLFKNLSAFFFTGGIWAYLVVTVLVPLLAPGEDVTSRMQLVHQCGLGAVVITGFTLMAALLYHQKPVPALLMTTLAGFLVGFGSLYPLLRPGSISTSSDMAIENRSSHGNKKHAQAEEESHHEEVTTTHASDDHASSDHHEPEHKPAKLKLAAQAPLAHEDEHEEESEEHLHKILSHEKTEAEHEDHESAPRTLTAAQKARLKQKTESAAKSRSAKAEKAAGKQKVSLAAKAPPPHAPKAKPPHAAHWEYAGAHGPEHWGEIDGAFKTCSSGLEQSPINILNAWPTRDAIELDYKPSTFQVVDNGHTVQVNVERGSYAIIGGQRYELKQFHFHTPSEHLLENRPYQMEVHFVHANDKGELAVIGAFINPGKVHPGYQTVWDYMPVKAKAPIKPYNVTLDIRRLLPTMLTAFHYSGSLTTPPCSEKVNWNVLHATLKFSQEQIDRFKLKYPMNARPAQPLNYRRP